MVPDSDASSPAAITAGSTCPAGSPPSRDRFRAGYAPSIAQPALAADPRATPCPAPDRVAVPPADRRSELRSLPADPILRRAELERRFDLGMSATSDYARGLRRALNRAIACGAW